MLKLKSSQMSNKSYMYTLTSSGLTKLQYRLYWCPQPFDRLGLPSMKFFSFCVRTTELTLKLKSSKMLSKLCTFASNGRTTRYMTLCSVAVHSLVVEFDFTLMKFFSFWVKSIELTLKLKSSQMLTKSYTLASSSLNSLYRCSVGVHDLLVSLVSVQ